MPSAARSTKVEEHPRSASSPPSPAPVPAHGTVRSGYAVNNRVVSDYSASADLDLVSPGPAQYGEDVPHLSFNVSFETPDRIKIVVADRTAERWRVPESVLPRPVRWNAEDWKGLLDANYEICWEHDGQPGFAVRRKTGTQATDDELFATAFQDLVFKDQYLKLSTKIAADDPNIYGFAESTTSFRKKEEPTLTLFTRDAPCPPDENIYGHHPFYIELRNGQAHGVVLVNSNGMDVKIAPPALTYHVIGGIFEFYVLLGPSPADVYSQYLDVVGRPAMIPKWALGFHQCRWGYRTLAQARQVIQKYKEADLPLDVMWLDIDYMKDFKCFTYDPTYFAVREMQKFVDELHAAHQHYVPILDPGIKTEPGYATYERGAARGIFLKNKDGEEYVDWFHPETSQWWATEIKKWTESVPVDGLWIDMNEPASFCDGECPPAQRLGPNVPIVPAALAELLGHENVDVLPDDKMVSLCEDYVLVDPNLKMEPPIPPSLPIGITNAPYKINNGGQQLDLATHTVAMDAVHHGGVKEYDAHCLFGHMEAMTTYSALKSTGKRPFILTRSTFLGTGKYAAHWFGDNQSTWASLRASVPTLLTFSILSIPLTGADIGGFSGTTTPELLSRWAQLGAFYPFARNHCDIASPPQEFYHWPSVTEVAKHTFSVRYSLLAYWYTLFFRARERQGYGGGDRGERTKKEAAGEGQGRSENGRGECGAPAYGVGGPIRPLWFEFLSSPSAVDDEDDRRMLLSNETQFLLGPAILVTPVLEEGATGVEGFVPGLTVAAGGDGAGGGGRDGEALGRSSSVRWYDYYSGREIGREGEANLTRTTGTTRRVWFEAPMDVGEPRIPLLLRGGYIVPTYTKPGLTVHETVAESGITLLVALPPQRAPSLTFRVGGHGNEEGDVGQIDAKGEVYVEWNEVSIDPVLGVDGTVIGLWARRSAPEIGSDGAPPEARAKVVAGGTGRGKSAGGWIERVKVCGGFWYADEQGGRRRDGWGATTPSPPRPVPVLVDLVVEGRLVREGLEVTRQEGWEVVEGFSVALGDRFVITPSPSTFSFPSPGSHAATDGDREGGPSRP